MNDSTNMVSVDGCALARLADVAAAVTDRSRTGPVYASHVHLWAHDGHLHMDTTGRHRMASGRVPQTHPQADGLDILLPVDVLRSARWYLDVLLRDYAVTASVLHADGQAIITLTTDTGASVTVSGRTGDMSQWPDLDQVWAGITPTADPQPVTWDARLAAPLIEAMGGWVTIRHASSSTTVMTTWDGSVIAALMPMVSDGPRDVWPGLLASGEES